MLLSVVLIFLISKISFAKTLTCFESGECIQSQFIKGTVLNSYNDCLLQCQEEFLCNWISFDELLGICELFQNCTEISEKNCENCLSSEKACPLRQCNVIGECQVRVRKNFAKYRKISQKVKIYHFT